MLFLVVDGSSMLVTNYYGNLPKQILFEKDEAKKAQHYDKIMHSSDGTYTNAIYGMLRTLIKIKKEQNPDYMAVVFDKTRNTFRRTELYADYKAQRSETPDPLKEQFILMEKILADIGIQVLYSDTYEADDLAGSVIRKFEGPDMQMRFMTKDHDYLQLISPYTRGWMVQTTKDKAAELYEKYYKPWNIDVSELNLPDKVFEYTEEYCLAEEGVMPCQIQDLKGISGDPSDNIPGIKGVSDKSAVPLLNEFGTLENILECIDECEGNEKKEKELAKEWKEHLGISRSPIKAFKEHKEMGLLSKKLATIKTDCEVPDKLEEYSVNIKMDKLIEILKKLEFKSILEGLETMED